MAFTDAQRRSQLYAATLDLLGGAVGLWGLEEDSGTEVTSAARKTLSFEPRVNDAQADLSDFVVADKGLAHHYQLNIDVGLIEHRGEWLRGPRTGSDFSFSNGTDDEAFSVGAWVYLQAGAPSSTILGKSLDDPAQGKEEWHFQTLGGGDFFSQKLMDAEAGASIRKESTDTLSSGTWYFLVATYDGSGAVSGIKLYKDGTLAGATTHTVGNYSAMQPEDEPVSIGGIRGQGSAPADTLQGRIMLPFVARKELSADEVFGLYRLSRAFVAE